jgi:hypothetical protein
LSISTVILIFKGFNKKTAERHTDDQYWSLWFLLITVCCILTFEHLFQPRSQCPRSPKSIVGISKVLRTKPFELSLTCYILGGLFALSVVLSFSHYLYSVIKGRRTQNIAFNTKLGEWRKHILSSWWQNYWTNPSQTSVDITPKGSYKVDLVAGVGKLMEIS